MEQSLVIGEKIGKQLNDPELQGLLLFSKGIEVNGSAIIQGIINGLNKILKFQLVVV